MLSNLASYLGYAAAPTAANTAPPAEEASPTATDVRLRTVEDDDWILVEKHDKAESMQESWYLTPPPSFSSDAPVHMETSPLENLLIEHPSMSVYQRRKDVASDDDTSARPKKYSKKRPTTCDETRSASEDEATTKELKMKSFVKSPRRSMNATLARKPSRRRPDVSSSDEMLSIPSTNEDEVVVPEVRKKLYSEVLATKPKVVEERREERRVEVPPPPPMPQNEAAPEAAHEAPIDQAVAVRDRRPVQTVGEQQNRLHFLNRSAQKTEQRKSCDVMKRNPLGRNNKARELNSRNKRQRRADMMQRHSGANNNRKC